MTYYLLGLPKAVTDAQLKGWCEPYGLVKSSKAIYMLLFVIYLILHNHLVRRIAPLNNTYVINCEIEFNSMDNAIAAKDFLHDTV
jgi:hypothetical protein